ncbi:hypothetical protein HMPREF1544_05063 [Mucor circinelloides 1006PhL]|uniref:Uncharacterized protein n=1 Tax=Mucor circinelloides f. circinelloides (strain 1006PhL) TaxID=1220926 RepID=S2JE55_MUCC1|nr:hypothetical protein HMPREF1544_05063 [Mucor circinelloides 1006PhL]
MSQELSTLQDHVAIELCAYQVNISALESRLKRLEFYSSLYSMAREYIASPAKDNTNTAALSMKKPTNAKEAASRLIDAEYSTGRTVHFE